MDAIVNHLKDKEYIGGAKALASAVLIGLAASALAGCNNQDVVASSPPQSVQTMTVALIPEAPEWSYVGVVRPRYESDLGFRVGGKIISRSVELGERVEASQIIARLDPTDLQLALGAQKAEFAAAKTSLDEAQAALGRYETLFQQGHVAKAALDQRVSAAAEAKSRVERSERNVSLADNQLSYATLKADHAGVVSALPIEVGQVVAAGQLVARVARLDSLEVEVAIPEQMLEAVKQARAEVELWSGGGKRLAAKLREVSPEADPVSRTYRARFAITESPRDIELGRTATVHLIGAGHGEVASLPLSAIMNDGKGARAWVVAADGTRAVPTPVDVQSIAQDRIIVKAGLKSGDRVVTLGLHMLDPDKPIRVIEQRTALQ
jgi:multidrug efflux system membrane fusion protein